MRLIKHLSNKWRISAVTDTAFVISIATLSKPNALAKLDGRTREAQLMKKVREELFAHVAGQPSATQRVLIERAVNLTMRLAVMDQKFAESKQQSDHDSRTYLAWSNTLTRTVRQLGLRAASAPPKSLHDHLASAA